MRTSRSVGAVLWYAVGAGCLIAVLGLSAVAGGIISESPSDTAVGWSVLAVGTAVLGTAALVLFARRHRHGHP